MKSAAIWFGAMLLCLSAGLLFTSCGTNDSVSTEILSDQEGTLIWGFEPARDGLGMLLETADTTYGLPGSFSDYSEFFDEEEYRASVIADIKLTGEITRRGFPGTAYPEIEIIRMNRIE